LTSTELKLLTFNPTLFTWNTTRVAGDVISVASKAGCVQGVEDRGLVSLPKKMNGLGLSLPRRIDIRLPPMAQGRSTRIISMID
jgi:hypothetical protein